MNLLRQLVLAGMLLAAGMNLFAQESAYAYDANGNLTKDLNKNIVDIQYNCLNLPCRIVFKNGDNISNVYSGDGTKLRTVQVIGGDTLTTDYCGNAIYENGVLVRLMTDVGYIAMADTSYHYFIKDHQGNVRVVADEDGNVEEVNDYYPFGGLMSTSSRRSVQPYKYNGKELETAGGLNWYDYGARRYDPVLGRWNGVDPSCEKHYSWSPYAYCKNNPVLRVDPDGKDDYTINDRGKLFRTPIIGSTYDRLILNKDKNISIVVNDKGLLSGMYAMQKAGKNQGTESYHSTVNLDDAVAVFKFGADNTKPEWKLDIYDDGGSKTAVVGTSGREGSVFSDVQDKLGVKGDKVVDLHSHPYNNVASDNDMKILKINTGAIYNRDGKELFFYNSKKSRIENKTSTISTSSELLKRLNDKFMK
ncbi:RHS repeat-associated core domain-containing protein [uncultured Bacteroides sp.]|uniref:RHS repeat-associated core domain-containing protein n=1 Tax=uncultured Bacteroides sp. TaxID=162156 RepID=UPI00280A8E53|nr:RHS repeat-associated core domain-containing protein [uncultured Bacteroides sp.]